MFFLIPGGASYVTFKLLCSKIGGNLWCGSVVNHSLNPSAGSSTFNSFSNTPSQLTTKCKFFKHSQSPFKAAALSISNA